MPAKIFARRMLSCEHLEARRLLAAQPMISEFLANNSALLDGYGESSDWIELSNVGDQAVDLAGFYLTDDAADLTKWTVPSLVLEPSEFFVVFASGRNSADPDGNLHTNFRLDQDGEYLALVEPDGETIVSQFDFSAQRADVSYGIESQLVSRTLVDAQSPARILIPGLANATIGTSWTGQAVSEPYDESSWTLGTAAMGYDLVGQEDPVNIAPFGVASQSTTDFGGQANRGTDENRSSFTHTANESDSWWRLDFASATNFGRLVIWNRADCCPERLSNFRVSVFDGSNVEVFGQDYYTEQQGGGHPLAGESVDVELPAGTVGTAVQIQFRGFNNAGNGWLSLGDVEVYELNGYDGLFTFDLQSTMRGLNSSAFARIPFEVDEVVASDLLSLRVHYDDGFVAYLNGQEVARRNAPAAPTWLSTSTTDRPRAQAMVAEEIDLRPHLGALQPGPNLLAVHGLNDGRNSDDFLFAAELIHSRVMGDRVAFFSPPTPGMPNAQGVIGFVADTSNSDIGRGIYAEPLETVVTTATPGATLVYTTDGTRPSLTNGVRVDAIDSQTPPSVRIRIDKTTTLRTAAFKPDFSPSRVDTQTYVLIEDVLRQPRRPTGFPTVWNGIAQTSIAADYEMDPEVVDSPNYRDEIRAGLTSIPSLSIVMDPEDLFGSERGIYTNSGQRGAAWEHPTSIEVLQPNGSSFQVDAGIRIHGFSWRFHDNTPKHSFRLEFRDEYGPTRLEYPLFPDAPVDRFDSIVLRAQGGRAWAGLQNPSEAQYIRDVFARDTARDMGKVDGHAAYFHLYLNGLYWGLYHAVERPDAQMAEEYFGGSSEDYDALNRRTTTNEAIDGDLSRYNEMIALANRGITSPEAYSEMLRYVDVDNLIDFFLIHQYMTNRDGPETFQSNNQRALGSRIGDPQFRFFVWDMEYSMWNVTDNINIDVDVPTSASRVYTALRQFPEFRLRYADRVQQHLFNDGALTPQAASDRWQARADEIRTAIIGESARWGDAKRATPYTRDVEWQRELDRLIEDYFPRRTDILLDQLRDAGLYPRVDSATFSQHGGQVTPDFELTMTAPSGDIYFTVDGSDPRTPSPAAQGGVLIPEGAIWSYLDDGSDQGFAWRDTDFDDSAWRAGPAELGYGDGDEATVVNCGPLAPGCATNNHITTYFRHAFTVDDPTKIDQLNLRIQRDDGAVIYINGQEVARTNMPDGRVDAHTLAARTGNERTFVALKIDRDSLVVGQNVMAVELHQRSATSDDIGFDLELSAVGAIGGVPSISARRYAGPIALGEDVSVKARVFDNGIWSALNAAEFLVGRAASFENLRITEIHYHPAEEADAEFVELMNISQAPVSLNGVRFENGIEFDFTNSQVHGLAAGERLVIVNSIDAFSRVYDVDGITIAGEFSAGRLSNGSDRLTLLAADGSPIHDFQYQDSDPWPGPADGAGPSLEVVDVHGEYRSPTNWRASLINGGTPGRETANASVAGDANRDGVFDSNDLLQVFQVGKYEDDIAENSTWADGDWNGDREFDSQDIVLAFQAGHYVPAARPKVLDVPLVESAFQTPPNALRPASDDVLAWELKWS